MAASKKAAKVKPVEYSETVEDIDLTGKAEQAEAPAEVASDGWEVGQPAPSTMYFDYDTNEITTEHPTRAQVVVFEGAQVTASILRQLGKA